MKKKLNICLIILILFLFAFTIFLLTQIPSLIKAKNNLETYIVNVNNYNPTDYELFHAYYDMFLLPYIFQLIFSLFGLVLSILIMVYINKADLQYLRENVFIPKLKEMQEKRKADKQSNEEEKRKQKIEELQKQIDELNKTDERP